MKNYDFSGWATRNNLQCSDNRIIMKDAFKHNDGKQVPLVWMHQHNDPDNVLGHAVLQNMDANSNKQTLINFSTAALSLDSISLILYFIGTPLLFIRLIIT